MRPMPPAGSLDPFQQQLQQSPAAPAGPPRLTGLCTLRGLVGFHTPQQAMDGHVLVHAHWPQRPAGLAEGQEPESWRSAPAKPP